MRDECYYSFYNLKHPVKDGPQFDLSQFVSSIGPSHMNEQVATKFSLWRHKDLMADSGMVSFNDINEYLANAFTDWKSRKTTFLLVSWRKTLINVKQLMC